MPLRVVQVFAPVGAGGLGRKGAGFLLGDGLVLTARHVIDGATGPCEVRALNDTTWVATTLLWPGETDGDGALLRLDGRLGDIDRVRLGQLLGNERAACEATGFPWAQLGCRDDDVPVRRSEHLVGEIDRFSGREPGAASWLLTVHVRGSVPIRRGNVASPWEGMSGAGLICGELLIGVVIVDPAHFGADRLLAVDLTRLMAAPGFAEALSEARGESVVLEAVEAQGVLARPYDSPPPRRRRQSSSFLLSAHYGVAPFRPRPELGQLRDWAVSGADVDVAVLTGPGGVGKTRLARELCVTADGWVAGPLVALPEYEPLERLARVDAPVLVVVDDYTEARRGDVIKLLEQLAGAASRRHPRRLLLNARQLGDWWTELRNDCTHDEIRGLLEGARTIEVGAAERTLVDRVAAYREAVAAYARYTGPADSDTVEPELSDRLFDTLLFIHMAALSALPGGENPSRSLGSIRTELLERTLEREERYWSRIARALDPPLLIDRHVQRCAVAIATLSASATNAPGGEHETAALLETLADLHREDGLRYRVARWLHELYRTPSGWIAPLEPDLLGEALVANALSTTPGLAGELLARADEPTALRALTVLTRASRHHDGCRVALVAALDTQLPRLAIIAIDVAEQLGDPIGAMLADAMRRHPDVALARAVLSRIPAHTASLRETAVVAGAQAVQRAHDDESQRAGLLVHQAHRLGDLGRRDDALAAIDEAVGVYRYLVGGRPDEFLPDLATALNSQSTLLTALGRREDALAAIDEAVGVYRHLVGGGPDGYLPSLAMALNNQSVCLSELGRREDAVAVIDEAVRLVLPIVERGNYFLPDAGLRLTQNYVKFCQDAEREPDADYIRRMHSVRAAAAVTTDDP